MAVEFALRHALRRTFSPAAAKELTTVLDAGIFIVSSSAQLRMDLGSKFSPGVVKELIAGLGSGGLGSPSQPLRTEVEATLGGVAGRQFLTLIAAVTSSSGDD